MSLIESKIKQDNEFIKKLFNFHEDEATHEDLKEIFSNLIKNSQNDSKYFTRIQLANSLPIVIQLLHIIFDK